MEYLLFTYPNCQRCEDIKGYLKDKALDLQEFNLVQKESKVKIRDFLKDIKRDDKGGIIIPTLIVREKGEIATVLNDREELQEWLKSRE